MTGAVGTVNIERVMTQYVSFSLPFGVHMQEELRHIQCEELEEQRSATLASLRLCAQSCRSQPVDNLTETDSHVS